MNTTPKFRDELYTTLKHLKDTIDPVGLEAFNSFESFTSNHRIAIRGITSEGVVGFIVLIVNPEFNQHLSAWVPLEVVTQARLSA